MSRSKTIKKTSRAQLAHRANRNTRLTHEDRSPYQVRKATPQEIAEQIAFERGLGAGSVAEFENLKEAATRAFAEGVAEGLARADVTVATASPNTTSTEKD